MERDRNLDVATIGQIGDLSDWNIELSGGLENEVGDYVGKARPTMPASPAATVESVGGHRQPRSMFSLAASK